jgi:hypothetical protein
MNAENVSDRMPGDAEAAGAIAGMQDVYGRHMPSVGDWVNGESAGRRWAGRVLRIDESTVVIDLDGEYGQLVARTSDIAGF